MKGVFKLFSTAFLKKYFICSFLEWGERREKERRETLMWERNMDQLPLVHTQTRDRTCNQACALKGNPVGEPRLSGLQYSLCAQQLSCTWLTISFFSFFQVAPKKYQANLSPILGAWPSGPSLMGPLRAGEAHCPPNSCREAGVWQGGECTAWRVQP